MAVVQPRYFCDSLMEYRNPHIQSLYPRESLSFSTSAYEVLQMLDHATDEGIYFTVKGFLFVWIIILMSFICRKIDGL